MNLEMPTTIRSHALTSNIMGTVDKYLLHLHLEHELSRSRNQQVMLRPSNPIPTLWLVGYFERSYLCVEDLNGLILKEDLEPNYLDHI